MNSLANIKPSVMLSKLSATAQLSNIVSRQALVDAKHGWSGYIATPNRLRCSDDMHDVADKLLLIINQVSNGCTRINPTAWHKLVRLEQDIRNAALRGVHLELNSSAVNDDDKMEVA